MHHSYEEALALIRTLPSFTATTTMPLAAAHGFFLAEDVRAPMPSPAFDNSAMDGFAFTRDEVSAGEPLAIIGTIHAGDAPTPSRPAQGGTCVRIMTGGAVPDWCDTVIPVEQSENLGDNRVRFTGLPERGAHIRRQGEDIGVGAWLLRRGQRLGPEQVMVAAAFGLCELRVIKPPVLGLFASGDELREPGEKLGPGQIYNSSRYFLQAAARSLQISVQGMATLPDHAERSADLLQPFLRQPTAEGGKLLVTTGAVSRGEKDFIPRLAMDLGFTPLLHRVAIRPGKPVFIAYKDRTIWVGLPGNPISTNVGWHFFLRPILAHSFGMPMPEALQAPLAAACPKPGGLTCFFRAHWRDGAVHIPRGQGSAHYQSSLDTHGFAILPAASHELAAGAKVAFHPHEGWTHL